MTNLIAVIPAYHPNDRLLPTAQELVQNGIITVVVDDGNSIEYQSIFKDLEDNGCTVLHHYQNCGKGRALKTAFNHLLCTYGKDFFVVCIDADGQHSVKDALRCLDKLKENPDCLVLGCRSFEGENVPKKSRIGNKIARLAFSALCGIKATDTQTGLRAMSGEALRSLILSKGERYEYEMHMLFDCKEKAIPLAEVPIETIYIENNVGSSFNPLKDSIRIYAVFAKFLMSSTVSFVVDFILFALLISLFRESIGKTLAIFLATFLARIVSSLVNYTINRNKVFRSPANKRKTFARYYLLCGTIMLLSAVFVNLLSVFFKAWEPALKLIVDTVLFLMSFKLQREWVFNASQEKRR